mmetsp:Transcript_1405/g.2765  ORF Transcript_1405/g.2765 Transcript_1405/m.2765 type:complete len:119 (+) Transcript_1405:260-616(+)
MGSNASSTAKVAEYRRQSSSSLSNNNNKTANMSKVQEALERTAKNETDGMVGCKSRGESKKRQLERKTAFNAKVKERTERKSKISQQWEQHRDQNAPPSHKSFFGRTKHEGPKHWYDD